MCWALCKAQHRRNNCPSHDGYLQQNSTSFDGDDYFFQLLLPCRADPIFLQIFSRNSIKSCICTSTAVKSTRALCKAPRTHDNDFDCFPLPDRLFQICPYSFSFFFSFFSLRLTHFGGYESNRRCGQLCISFLYGGPLQSTPYRRQTTTSPSHDG